MASRKMHLYKFLFVLFACILFPSNSGTNDTKINNFNNETDITEMSLCENYSTTCYPHSTEVSTDMSFFQTEDNISTTYKKTTIFYEDTTSLPSSTLPPQIKKEPTDMENCPCDLTPYICDMNCCCDVDCSEWERDAFYSCTRLAPEPSFGQCMTTDIIYKNNTAYPITRSVNGLLCISKDNFPERNAYIDQDCYNGACWKVKEKRVPTPTANRSQYLMNRCSCLGSSSCFARFKSTSLRYTLFPGSL